MQRLSHSLSTLHMRHDLLACHFHKLELQIFKLRISIIYFGKQKKLQQFQTIIFNQYARLFNFNYSFTYTNAIDFLWMNFSFQIWKTEQTDEKSGNFQTLLKNREGKM